MYHQLSHFAIFTEDIKRAKSFYQAVFGWHFNTNGAPSFAQINSSKDKDAPLIGALQDRQYQLTDERVIGFECSITVQDVDAVAALVLDNGGKILMPKAEVPNVGSLIKFRDTEGNIVCAIQYLDHVREAMSR